MTIALILEIVALLFGLGSIAIVMTAALGAGAGVPTLFITAMAVLIGMMVVRVGALVLVRAGNGWARWIYLAGFIVGTVWLLTVPPLPIVGLLTFVAIVSIILIFIPPTNRWVKARAAQR